MAAVEIKNLKFSYPLSDSEALNGVDLTVERGEICLIIGESGSGKSTLLRLLKKEIAPFGKMSGEINVGLKTVGFVGQNIESNIITNSVGSELAFSPQNMGFGRMRTYLAVAETASYFDLGGIVNKSTAELSGGEKQTVALAAAFTTGAELLLLDEPVSQLDPAASEEFINLVLKLNREQGATVLISGHRIEGLLPIADKAALMERGKIVFCGSPRETAEFLVKTDHRMKCALPQYTQVFEGNPLNFAQAEKQVGRLIYKDFIPRKNNGESVCVKGICFTYKKGAPDVFFGLDYTAERGKINAIVGANGSGKTTLLKCIASILKYYGGKIKSDGKTAYMPQNVQTLFLEETVAEEIGGADLPESLRLEQLADRNPFDLSGGEAQRLALAKLISVDADILLLDEPTKSVDAPFCAELAEILRGLTDGGKTVIIATHDLEFAARYADNCAFLFNGRIAASAPCREFFSTLRIYTTSISKLTEGKAVCIDDIEVRR